MQQFQAVTNAKLMLECFIDKSTIDNTVQFFAKKYTTFIKETQIPGPIWGEAGPFRIFDMKIDNS